MHPADYNPVRITLHYISVFGYGKNIKYPSYVSKNIVKKYVYLQLRGEEGKRLYVFIKDLSTFMYDSTLHRGRKSVCRYCLQAFSTKELLKCYNKDWFEINGKWRIKMC